MDSSRFDTLARRLAARLSRRAGIGAAFGLAAGVVFRSGAPPAGATACRPGHHSCTRDGQCCSGSCPVGRGVPIHRRNRCTCEAELTPCGGRCVDLETNSSHCGACGNRCAMGWPCVNGACLDPDPCHHSTAFVCMASSDGEVFEWTGDESICVSDLPGDTDATSCQTRADCLDAFHALPEDDQIELSIYDLYCMTSITVSGYDWPRLEFCVLVDMSAEACV